MKINKFHIYLADLNPAFGTEPGKVRPVIVVQTDLINGFHPSTIICPLTSHLVNEGYPLRLRLKSKESGLVSDSDVLIDQIRSIDNRRFKKHVGRLSAPKENELMESLNVLLWE